MRKIKIEEIKAHPINAELYKQRDDIALSNSIIANGITKPPVVNQDGVLIAGHRTVAAAKIAGIKEINCQEVKVRDDNHHIELLILDNLSARGGTELYPSEMAKSVAKLYELGGLSRGGDRKSKNQSDTVTLWSLDELAKKIGIGKRSIMRYNTLSNLIPELLDQLDDGKLKQSNALKIAKLSVAAQKNVVDDPIELPREKKHKALMPSSSTITTKEIELEKEVLSLTVQLETIQNKEIDKKIQYINKHGNDIQRQAVKRGDPKVVNKIHEVVHNTYTTTKEMSPAFPPPMNQSPTTGSKNFEELQRKYDELYEAHDKLLDETMKLEAEVIDLRHTLNGGQKPEIIKDYTTLHGSDITPEELDKAKLLFSDPDTYKRLMVEYQRDQNAS
jgi:ParB-like chromosome segregation protein Spo0J